MILLLIPVGIVATVLIAYIIVAICDVVSNIIHVESFRQGRE